MNRSAGFSLIEVLCAVLVLGIGIVGLIQGTTLALRSSRETEQQTAAALLAAARLETLRADGFVVEGETEGDGEEDLARYHWKQSVSRTRTDGLYEVAVDVADSRSGSSIYELRTLLFDPSTLSPDAGEEKKASGPGKLRGRRP